jgi:sensor histidine kinase YesM
MPTPAACEAAPPGATALGAAAARWRRHASRTLVFMVTLCVAIALLLSAFDGGGLGTKLIYSFAIGMSCVVVIDGTRLGFAALTDGLRRWRGLPASPSGFGSGWRGVVPAMLLCILIGPFVGIGIADRLTGNRSPSLFQLDSPATRVTLTLTVLGSLVSVFALSTLERLASARALAEAAQRQATEARLRLLESQLEPHMLFNTLANLRVLIGLDPPRAQAMLDRLNDYLRATLYASRAGHQTLAAEFDRVADYLALMGMRMGPRLQVGLDLPEALRARPVPPLLLQPLVENAIKHGLEPKVDGGRIDIRARREGAALRLEVRDTGLGLDAAPPALASAGGFGLQLVRDRLATLYGARAGLTLAPAGDAEGGTTATVRLPFDDRASG